MTSLSRKLFIKLGAGAFLVVVLLALVVGAMLYYTAFRVSNLPGVEEVIQDDLFQENCSSIPIRLCS